MRKKQENIHYIRKKSERKLKKSTKDCNIERNEGNRPTETERESKNKRNFEAISGLSATPRELIQTSSRSSSINIECRMERTSHSWLSKIFCFFCPLQVVSLILRLHFCFQCPQGHASRQDVRGGWGSGRTRVESNTSRRQNS